MPFELSTPTAVTLTSATPRTELHGEDRVVAISLGLKLSGPNTLLDNLSSSLRRTLYTAPEGQEVLPGVEEVTPLLRTRGIEQLTLAGSLEGWTLTVDHGISDETAIVLGGCKVDKFRVTPHEGGTVDVLFRVGSSDVDAEELGLLCSKLTQEIDITLKAPVKTEGPSIDGTTGHPGLADSQAAQAEREAGDLFSERHAGDFGAYAGEDHEEEAPQLDGEGPEDDGAADSEGGETDVSSGADEAAEFEAGASAAMAAAGLEPKGRRRGGLRVVGVE